MNKIKKYNQEVEKWDFDRSGIPEFLRLLTDRNLYVLGRTPLVDLHPDCKNQSRNSVVVDSSAIGNLEHIAFHLGLPHQKRLHTLINEDTGSESNEGVFFSLKPEDAVYFEEFDKTPLSMVYFLDCGSANGVEVQTEYDSSTISRYDLDDMLKVVRDKKRLKKRHRELNQDWIRQNAIPFNIERLDEFKEKRYNWLLVPAPIDVKY